ncbi:Glyoxylate reductase [Plasmodiophora brassicae]|uniref:Glyoxylate reductase n=1 Tax=Plasmodiophora brassicae TaxID=37360 RepID=A0A3P3YFT7_PLABS|nr:unnamed protein product [Plasmodiophora brassicae]
MSGAGSARRFGMRVLVTRRLPPGAHGRLVGLAASQGFEVDLWDHDAPAIPRGQLLERVRGCHGALVLLTDRVDEELLDAAGPQLAVVSTMSVGFDHIDIGSCRRRAIRIGTTPDVLTDATADLTVGLLIAVLRRFQPAMRAARDGSWGIWSPTWMCGSDLRGKTIGLIGMGRIGAAVADRLAPFKTGPIQYCSRSEKRALPHRFVSLEDLLRTSDIVIVTCALSDDTRALITMAQLTLMKRTAFLINTARGPIVNAHDLALALRQGVIAGAGLDVTDPEPIRPDDPLLSLDNCLILPHVGSATMETREAMANLAIDNLFAALQGRPMPAELRP